MTAPLPTPPHILLLTIDAWRADFVSEYKGIPLLPSLARVADRTVRFANAYANGPWTTPGLVSLFTGQSPLHHGVHFAWSQPRPNGRGLAQVLQDAGYRAPNLSYLNGVENYWHLGFEPRETPARPTDADDDRVLLEAFATAGDAPCFWWFHDKWVHLPYVGDEPARRALGVEPVPAHLAETVADLFVLERHRYTLDPADSEVIRRLYAANVRALDRRLARWLDALEAHGLQDRTVIVLTTDHGEELMERGHVGHASTAEHATLFEEQLRIPLLVIDPRVRAPRTVQTRVQQLDLYATVLGLAGVPAPPHRGVDLSPWVWGEGEPSVAPDRLFLSHSARRGYRTPEAERTHQITAVSDGRWKLVDARYGDGFDPVLYDLQADPGERHPLRDRALLGEWLQRLAQAWAG
ncbi:MAG: sulfatase [Myxococcales bacterium]|nr:sulfatase [Myxococcales bacterium]